MSPFSQRLNLRWRQKMWSCVLVLAGGFCSINESRVIAAFSSRSDSVAKPLKRQVSSVTNCLPHAPDGVLRISPPVKYLSIYYFGISLPNTSPQDEVILSTGLYDGRSCVSTSVVKRGISVLTSSNISPMSLTYFHACMHAKRGGEEGLGKPGVGRQKTV